MTLARYDAYLSGSLTLRRSEEEQIGFRLAKMMGHTHIYPVDVKMNLNSDAVGKLVQENPEKFGHYFSKLQEVGNLAMEEIGKWLQSGTIREVLYKMNDPELERIAHQVYFYTFIPVVEGHNYAGADMVSTWYKRNLQIFSNLNEMATEPGDRILVVYGQGHIPLLKQFVSDSPYFTIEDVQPYLSK